MTKISRIKLNGASEKKLVKILTLILAGIKNTEKMESFMFSLMTSSERLMLAKRIAIIILIQEGLPPTNIAHALHVTRPTVSRMQLIMEARGTGYEYAFEILRKAKLMEDLKKILVGLARYSAAAAGGRIKF